MLLEVQQFIQDTESYEVQFLSKFTEAELKYLQSQRLGRLATVNQRGEPQVAAVGFRYNPEFDTIDIGGYDVANTQKFRNIARNGLASFLVDDVLPPWKTRSMEIRGHAQALLDGGQSIGYIGPTMSPALIRITPRRIIFWDATIDPPIGSKRNV
jgi:pyridoxamine 5'-phosphate oxidase family protein